MSSRTVEEAVLEITALLESIEQGLRSLRALPEIGKEQSARDTIQAINSQLYRLRSAWLCDDMAACLEAS